MVKRERERGEARRDFRAERSAKIPVVTFTSRERAKVKAKTDREDRRMGRHVEKPKEISFGFLFRLFFLFRFSCSAVLACVHILFVVGYSLPFPPSFTGVGASAHFRS